MILYLHGADTAAKKSSISKQRYVVRLPWYNDPNPPPSTTPPSTDSVRVCVTHTQILTEKGHTHTHHHHTRNFSLGGVIFGVATPPHRKSVTQPSAGNFVCLAGMNFFLTQPPNLFLVVVRPTPRKIFKLFYVTF